MKKGKPVTKADITSAYEDPKKGFIRPELLKKQLKDEGKEISIEKLEDKLEGVDTYTLNKPAKKNFQRRRVYVGGIDEQWQADLVDMTRFAKENDGYKFILTVIDVLSKYAWAVPMKNKTGPETAKAFKSIFTSPSERIVRDGDYREPEKIQTDDGKEFYNKDVKELFNKHQIELFSTGNETKASIIERFNRTLKEKMYKLFDVNQNFRYIDDLQDLLDNYNSTYHSSIKMKPIDVNDETEEEAYSNLYGDDAYLDQIYPELKVGNYVRIANARHIFGKSFEGLWSIEVFKVSEVQDTDPPTYKIEDLLKEPIVGSFYEEELQKVKKPTKNRIEKIVKRRTVPKGRGQQKQVLIKWLGYPDKFNDWIPEKDVIDY
eukprot:Lithocolla_globosa_v1_NODE_27_length_9260_cov_179.654861.p2 type:complete len:375 gc:universal NODE_27_length_9260_cov_179.654861:3496-4620(+)